MNKLKARSDGFTTMYCSKIILPWWKHLLNLIPGINYTSHKGVFKFRTKVSYKITEKEKKKKFFSFNPPHAKT